MISFGSFCSFCQNTKPNVTGTYCTFFRFPNVSCFV